jgi:hypothetical protein
MKTRLLLISLSFTVYLHAQVPDYLSNDPNWRQELWFGGFMPCLETHNKVYYIAGDSIVNDIAYKKLHSRGEVEYRWMAEPPPAFCEGSYIFDHFYHLIRQEDFKLLIYENGTEYLLYNFDLAVGDTLPYSWNVWDDVWVTAVESIPVGNEYRKVFSLSDNLGQTPLLIEGVGLTTGLIEPYPNMYPSSLLCFTLGDTTWYPGYGEVCDLSVRQVDLPKQKNIVCYPNPVKDKLYVENPGQSAFSRITFYDLSGRAHQLPLPRAGENPTAIDLSDFPAGFYIIEFYDEDNASRRTKIAKTD